MVAGLAPGGLCGDCARVVSRRAGRWSRWIAMGSTVPFAVYLVVVLPPVREWRLMAAALVVVWYVLVSIIARRVALLWLQ